MWAGHQTHHSSQEYNLSTALRQSTIHRYIGLPVRSLASGKITGTELLKQDKLSVLKFGTLFSIFSNLMLLPQLEFTKCFSE